MLLGLQLCSKRYLDPHCGASHSANTQLPVSVFSSSGESSRNDDYTGRNATVSSARPRILNASCVNAENRVSLIRPHSCKTGILLYPAVSYRILPYPAATCRILPLPAVSCRILPYLPYPAVSCFPCRILLNASTPNPNPNPIPKRNPSPNRNPNLEFHLLLAPFDTIGKGLINLFDTAIPLRL